MNLNLHTIFYGMTFNHMLILSLPYAILVFSFVNFLFTTYLMQLFLVELSSIIVLLNYIFKWLKLVLVLSVRSQCMCICFFNV